MPGIAAIIGTGDERVCGEQIRRMIDSMMHEPFYSSGTYVNRSLGVYVGWVALDGAFADCMPVWNERKDSCLIFSGEVFPDKGDLEQLKNRGHEFDISNATYLIHLYEEKGEAFIDDLNGRFNGVLIDISRKKVILFNDRFGMQRIYLHEKDGSFYFSSEAKSLLRILPALRSLDDQGLGEVFSCGCVLEDRTLFRGVGLLPPASKWTFSGGGVTGKERYFELSRWEDQPELDAERYSRRLRDTFVRILPRYFSSRQPVGMSLTGGLDTRMIMAYAGLPPGELPCYTFGSMYRDTADVRIARKVARACRRPYKVLLIGKDFLADFPRLAGKAVHITDGALDVSGSAELYANGWARGVAPVRMTGNYGSEVLRGNVAFRPSLPPEGLFQPDFYVKVRDAGKTYAEIRKGHPLSFILRRQAPWHHYGRLALEQSQVTIRSPYLDNDLVGLAYRAPRSEGSGEDVSRRVVEAGDLALRGIPSDRGVGGRSLFPWGARLLQELTVKAEYAYDYGMPQWVAKLDHLLAPLHVERRFLGRHKFCHFRTWYGNELSGYVREVLSDGRTGDRPYIDKRFLVKMVDGHLRGDRNYTTEIHGILTAEMIHRLFIDR